MPEGYFIVHVHANGAREVIKVEEAEWQITQEFEDTMWDRPWAYSMPVRCRIRLEGYFREGVFYDPNQAPDFTVDDQPAIEAPRLAIEGEDG